MEARVGGFGSKTYGSIPEGTSKLDGLRKHRFGFLGGQFSPYHGTHPHRPEARDWDLNLAKRKCLNHF